MSLKVLKSLPFLLICSLTITTINDTTNATTANKHTMLIKVNARSNAVLLRHQLGFLK